MYHFRILGLTAALLSAPAYADGLTDPVFQQITAQTFRPLIAEFDIPGIAIGVTYKGQHYVYTEGLASRAEVLPVTADTLFELGSVSKLFNVTLAGLAEARGLMSLDAPVSDVLPQLRGSAFDRITLVDLASHATGGLPLQVPHEIRDTDGLMAYLSAWRPEADTKALRSYSNVSIGLLGLIVGDRMGRSYDVALKETLLPELGLENTFVHVPDAAMGRYAFGYSREGDRPIRVSPGLLDAEAYGIKSSAADMTRFLDAQLGNLDLHTDVALALIRTHSTEYDTAHYAQAMIWEGYPWPVDPAQLAAGNAADMVLTPQPVTHHAPQQLQGDVFLNKTGSTNGFGSYVAMVPSENIGVVVLANRNYPNQARADATLNLIKALIEAAAD
jgi:beta-lactamase class C